MNNMQMNENRFQASSESHEPFETRCTRVLQVAKDLFQRNPDWVTFFREVLGVSGSARNVFATNQEYLAFEQSEEYGQIQQMVSNLRNRKIPGSGHNEPTRVITVRLPESLHEALKVEATDHRTSMNKLCISKLLQVLAESQPASNAIPNAPANRNMGSSSSRPPVPSARNTPPVPQPSNPVPAPSNPVPQPSRPVASSVTSPVPSPSRPVPGPSIPFRSDSSNQG